MIQYYKFLYRNKMAITLLAYLVYELRVRLVWFNIFKLLNDFS